MITKFRTLYIISSALVFSLVISCSTKSDAKEPLVEEPEKETLTISQTCDEISDFPNLGPSASQSKSCDDLADPNNKGTLDCRTDKTVGGYDNIADGWGSYKITGSTIRYDGTQTRVERFFKTISQGTSKKSILSGKLKIIDLSDANTCIVQSHGGGNIIKGEEQGSINRSAQFLVYAMKATGNKVKLETHVTINPYTTDTGGSRDVKEFAILNFNQEYDFIYETGYDDTGVAFSKIKVGNTEKYITHNHTTQRVYSRYGAYGASDTGDVTAHVQFKDISLCRE